MNFDYLTTAEEKITNTPMLVNLISYRTRQLNSGARPMVKKDHAEMDNHDIVLKEIAEGVRLAHIAHGSKAKETAAAEQGNRDAFRRSAFALRDLKAGEALTPADYRFVRPNAGVPVSDKPALIDRTLARDVKQFDPITYEDLAPR